MTKPGIPNNYALSTSCYGTRLKTIEDQAFAAVAMGFRRLEIGLLDAPVTLNGFEDTRRETGISVNSMVCGCLKPRTENMTGMRLGSLDEDLRECALNSVRRHAQLAQRYQCPTLILRGCAVENPEVTNEGNDLYARLVAEGDSDPLSGEIGGFVKRAGVEGHKQIEHLCRAIHSLHQEFPELTFALEPGVHFSDILSFEAMGWVLEDLSKQGVAYWHDTGTVHLREYAGLPGQGQWLDAFSDRMVGVHLQGAAQLTSNLPPGSGEVDFKLVSDYVPRDAERVVETDPRHGRSEILASVQFLVDMGF